MEAVLIICHDFLSIYSGLKGGQTLRSTEAVVSLSFFHQLLCVLQVNTGCLALALDIRAASSVLVRTLVMDQACILQGLVYDFHCPFHETFLVCIFNTEKEIPSLMLCYEIGIQCRP